MCGKLTCLGSLVLTLGFQAAGLAQGDLQGYGASCSVDEDRKLDISFWIENVGDEGVEYPGCTIYLSEDTKPGGQVLWSGTFLIEYLGPGQVQGIGWPDPFPCPEDYPAGTYYIVIELIPGGYSFYTRVEIPDPPPKIGGVTAEYFAGIFPQGTPCLIQTEPNINHDWRGGEVACGLSERVSARWTASLDIPSPGTYTFTAYSDDGVLVWLNGMSIIDNWTNQGPMSSVPLQLQPGDYTLRMEWYQNVSEAFAQLLWDGPWRELEIIPQSRLRPSQPSNGPDPNGTPTGIKSIGIDSFEYYTNNFSAGQAVFQTWIGGGLWLEDYEGPNVPDNGTRAIVGHDIWSPGTPYDTIMETEIVCSGNQSMPVYYDNSKSPFYSQVDRTWDEPQNWAVEGIDTLSIRVHGQPGNDPTQLYIEVEDYEGLASTVFNSDPDLLQRDEWIQWKIPLSDFADKDVNLKRIKRMSIGMRNPIDVTPQNGISPMQANDSGDYSMVAFELLQLLAAIGVKGGVLAGYVLEEGTNAPIQNARVILDPTDHSGQLSCVSVERGFYMLDPTLDAWYNLSVEATDDYDIHMESDLKFEEHINVKLITLKPVTE